MCKFCVHYRVCIILLVKLNIDFYGWHQALCAKELVKSTRVGLWDILVTIRGKSQPRPALLRRHVLQPEQNRVITKRNLDQVGGGGEGELKTTSVWATILTNLLLHQLYLLLHSFNHFKDCTHTHATYSPGHTCNYVWVFALERCGGGGEGRDSSNSGSAHSPPYLLLTTRSVLVSNCCYYLYISVAGVILLDLDGCLNQILNQLSQKLTLFLFFVVASKLFLFLEKNFNCDFLSSSKTLVSDLKILWIGETTPLLLLLRWRVTSSSAWSGTTIARPSSPSSTRSSRRSPSSTSHSARRVNSSGLTGSFFRHAHPTSR